MSHLLICICDCKKHTTTPCGRFRCHHDGKVIMEWVWDERLCEAANVCIWAKAVGRVAFEPPNKGDRWGEGNADQFCQVQGALRTAVCHKSNIGSAQCVSGGEKENSGVH